MHYLQVSARQSPEIRHIRDSVLHTHYLCYIAGMRGIVFTVLGLLPLVWGHPYYRDYIPNGYAVFNPCGASYWEAVGHFDPNHHTVLKNPFGIVSTCCKLKLTNGILNDF